MKVKEPANPMVVQAYLQKVKDTFSNETYVYVEFIGIMNEFAAKKIDCFETTSRICKIFRNHHELITGFSGFLPSGMDVIIEGNRFYFQDGEEKKLLVDDSDVEQMGGKGEDEVEIKKEISFIVGSDEGPEENMDEQTNDNDVKEVKATTSKTEEVEATKAEEVVCDEKQRREIEKAKKFVFRSFILCILTMFLSIYVEVYVAKAHASVAEVIFFPPNNTTTHNCKLVNMRPIKGNENLTEFEFKFEIERPWAKLEGNWKGYDFKFREYVFGTESGTIHSNNKDWDKPRRKMVSYREIVHIRDAFLMEFSGGLQIETNAPIKGKEFINVRYHVDCHEAIQKQWSQFVAKMK